MTHKDLFAQYSKYIGQSIENIADEELLRNLHTTPYKKEFVSLLFMNSTSSDAIISMLSLLFIWEDFSWKDWVFILNANTERKYNESRKHLYFNGDEGWGDLIFAVNILGVFPFDSLAFAEDEMRKTIYSFSNTFAVRFYQYDIRDVKEDFSIPQRVIRDISNRLILQGATPAPENSDLLRAALKTWIQSSK